MSGAARCSQQWRARDVSEPERLSVTVKYVVSACTVLLLALAGRGPASARTEIEK